MTLHIDIASDIVCPWCYIGKRHLEQALEMYADEYPHAPAPTLTWLPFQLNPDMPPQGMSRAEYVERKFGRPADEVYARVQGVGETVDIAFAFDQITQQPNTIKAHALVDLAAQFGLQPQVKEALMHAYFCDGADLTSDATMAHIAVRCGVPLEAAVARLKDSAALQRIAQQDAELRALGITGVPFFIFNRKVGVSGAQPAEQLLAAMVQAESLHA
jgi:predicted DsbA family dithiol-disulfide isomerase